MDHTIASVTLLRLNAPKVVGYHTDYIMNRFHMPKATFSAFITQQIRELLVNVPTGEHSVLISEKEITFNFCYVMCFLYQS